MAALSGYEHRLGRISHVNVESTIQIFFSGDGDAVDSNISGNVKFCDTAEVSEQITRAQRLFSIQGEMFEDFTIFTVLYSGEVNTTCRNGAVPREDTDDGAIILVKCTGSVDVLNELEISNSSRCSSGKNGTVAILVDESDAVAFIPIVHRTVTVLMNLNVIHDFVFLYIDANVVIVGSLVLVARCHCQAHSGEGKHVNGQFFHFFSPCLVSLTLFVNRPKLISRSCRRYLNRGCLRYRPEPRCLQNPSQRGRSSFQP